MTKVKAIIFDMDGVLIDAKDWHYDALNNALDLFGMTISRYDHLTTFDGLPTKKKLEILSVEKGLPRGVHEAINSLKQKFTMNLIAQKCVPTFEHEYALKRLKKEGYKLVVCSNSIRSTMEFMLERANLVPLLDFFLSNEDVDQPKPSPEIYLKAIRRLELKPDECLVLEDNENGIKAALEAKTHLLKINDVSDVTYQNIMAKLQTI